MRPLDYLDSDEDVVRLIDDLKCYLKPALRYDDDGDINPIAWALNTALNKIIVDFGLGWDPHAFARLPEDK